MATKDQVIELNLERPEMSAADIAKELNCHPAYVRKTAWRYKLQIPGTRKPMTPEQQLERALTMRREGNKMLERAAKVERSAIDAMRLRDAAAAHS